MILVISSSLNPDSNSRILAEEAHRFLTADGHAVSLLDLREHPLPLCDGGAAYEHPSVVRVGQLVRAAEALIVATPIYNFDATAAIKNLIELTGDGWENKVVGFLCAAGGPNSYMSVMSLANSLMLDFRCVVVPRFVYATGEAFVRGQIVDPEVSRRVAELAARVAMLRGALRAVAA